MSKIDEVYDNNIHSSVAVGDTPPSQTQRANQTLHRYIQLLHLKFEQPPEVLHEQQKMLDELNKRLQRMYADAKNVSEPSSHRTYFENC
jgi:hypothetical protein